MQLPKIPLFNWLLKYMPEAKYDFGNSSITGVTFQELQQMTGFEIPADLNLGKNDPYGAEVLRNVLANIYNCDENHVVPTTGGSEANFLVFLALLEPGDEVIVEQPGYSPLWLVPEMLGARIIKWNRQFENGFDLNIESLQEKITSKTKMIVLTNLHNPTGVLAKRDTVRAISELATDNDAVVLIDEMFLDVAKETQTSAADLESVIVTSSVSKIYGIGGLRTGWIIGEKQMVKRCIDAKWQATVAAPYLSELIVGEALTKARGTLVNRCKEIANQNFTIVYDWMKENVNNIEWVEPAGGILCFPKYRANIDSVKLGQILMDTKNVLISPGKYFGCEGYFRLTYMNQKNVLENGLAKLAEALKEITD